SDDGGERTHNDQDHTHTCGAWVLTSCADDRRRRWHSSPHPPRSRRRTPVRLPARERQQPGHLARRRQPPATTHAVPRTVQGTGYFFAVLTRRLATAGAVGSASMPSSGSAGAVPLGAGPRDPAPPTPGGGGGGG